MNLNDNACAAIGTTGSDRSAAALMPIMAKAFIAVPVISLAMPCALHVDLGFSNFASGLASCSQFAASFISRIWAGPHADKKGARHAASLLIAAASGLFAR
jgi:hypothetical protein